MADPNGMPPGPSKPHHLLQACPACARLFEVAGLAVGAPVRCACGHATNVARAEPIVARALVCRRCGGPFQSGASACPWCEAGIVLEDRHLAGVCGRCCMRLSADAQFCPGCGTRVRVQALSALKTDAACPRCEKSLRLRRVDEIEIVECSSCAGLWLPPATFEGLCRDAEEAGLLRRALQSGGPVAQPVRETVVRYLPCVTCGERMSRKNFGGGSGVLVDVCKDHGVWFDSDELVRALDWAQGGGLERAREKERARLATERERKATPTIPGARIEIDPWERRGEFDLAGLDLLDVVAAVGRLARKLLAK